MVCGLGDDGESHSCVVVVDVVGVEVSEVVLQQQLVLGQSLDWLEKVVRQLEITALGEPLKLLQERSLK